jgi:hypothetical protein
MLQVSALQEAEKLLSIMTPAEKAQVLQWVVRDLGDAFPGIESNPGVSGGESLVSFGLEFRFGFWYRPNGWGRAKQIYYGLIQRYEPKIWRMLGPMLAYIKMKLSNRSTRTRKPKVWPNSTATKIFLCQLLRNFIFPEKPHAIYARNLLNTCAHSAEDLQRL